LTEAISLTLACAFVERAISSIFILASLIIPWTSLPSFYRLFSYLFIQLSLMPFMILLLILILIGFD